MTKHEYEIYSLETIVSKDDCDIIKRFTGGGPTGDGTHVADIKAEAMGLIADGFVATLIQDVYGYIRDAKDTELLERLDTLQNALTIGREPVTPQHFTDINAMEVVNACGIAEKHIFQDFMHSGEYEGGRDGVMEGMSMNNEEWVESMTLSDLKGYMIDHIGDHSTSLCGGWIIDMHEAIRARKGGV